jgi:hypothetical protein
MLGLVFLFESACVSRAVAPKPMRPSCANYVDDQLHPRERPGAVLRWRIAEGAPGREYEMLVELDRTGRLSFVDIRWSAPGPEGLASRGHLRNRRWTVSRLRSLRIDSARRRSSNPTRTWRRTTSTSTSDGSIARSTSTNAKTP